MKKNSFKWNNLFGKPEHYYERFHEFTSIKKFKKNKVKNYPFDTEYKGYPRLPAVKLPKPMLIKTPFSTVFYNRKSMREFNLAPLSLTKLSTLLYYSAGEFTKSGLPNARRFYPSAGARYPLETYLISRNVQRLEPALYHYYIRTHCLEKLDMYKKSLVDECFKQPLASNAHTLFVMTAIFNRTVKKYDERGYRHILAEAGHLAQNVYLVSSALKLRCCAIGGYIDSGLNDLIDIDGLSETVVYVLAIGH
jgi:SagB-type dehydrogenase family enzyme